MPGCLAFLTSLDLSLDQADAVQAGPIVTRVKPVDVGNGPMAANFQPAMVVVDGLVELGLAMGEATGLLFGKEEVEVLA